MAIDLIYEIDVADPNFFRKLESFPEEVNRLVRDAVNDLAIAIESEARGRAPHRTGNLIRNISHDAARPLEPGHVEAQVGLRKQAPYGIWVHEGTGIFGRYHRRITPTTGNFLAFRTRSGRIIFTKSVLGQRAQPFFREAFEIVTKTYAPVRMQKLAHDIGNLG